MKNIYFCDNCQSRIEIERDKDIKDYSCCKKSDLKYMASTFEDEEIEKAKEGFKAAYQRIISIMDYYIDIKLENKKIIALWILGTYLHDQFETYPYLFLNAMKGSGKTRTLKVISHLAAGSDGSVYNSLTEASIFRMPKHSTLCLDEFEQVGSREKQALREVLNSAYKRGGKVVRVKKVKTNGEEKQVSESFEPFFPVAMANIWGMDETLGDRALTLILEKSGNQAVTKKQENFTTNPAFQEIKRTLEYYKPIFMTLCRYMMSGGVWNSYIDLHYNSIISHTSHTSLTTQTPQQSLILVELDDRTLRICEKIDKTDIDGRNLELAFPLLNIALILDESIFDDILEVLTHIIKEKKEDDMMESKDTSLIDFVSRQYDAQIEFISIKELVMRFRDFMGTEEDKDRWLNEKWFGRALKRLGLVVDKRKRTKGAEVTLNVPKAKEKLKLFRKEEMKE